MVRLLHLISLLAVVSAGGILILCAGRWLRSNHTTIDLQTRMGAIQALTERVGQANTAEKENISPLVAQAQAYAALLNPPKPAVKQTPVVQEATKPPMPPVQSAAVSPKFKVRGTSYFADEPQRSMALIWEPGATDSGRWVKEGTQVGHYIVHEIRPGSIVCKAGDKLCELALEEEVATATAAASSEPPAKPEPRTTASNARAPQPARSLKRPVGGRGPTVGSARTAALD